ncbi:hypothetical protein [Erythrobacter sp. CCH5-A1]|nr:hypothetical protein [Erythrobacter sp. CCH5-A1]
MPSDETIRRLQRAVKAFCIATAFLTATAIIVILEEAAPRIALELAAR